MGQQIDKIRVSAGEDLLAFIPHMVGYWPERSVVCIGMSGKRLRATLRLDLPCEHGANIAHFAAVAAAQLASDTEADGCLLAIFGEEDWSVPQESPQGGLYAELCVAFAKCGLPVRDAWFVGLNHWRSFACQDPQCCPWPGKDNSSIRESFVNAEFIFRGSMVRNCPKEQIQELTAFGDPVFADAVMAAGADLREPLVRFGLARQQLSATLEAWELSLTCWPIPPEPDMVAYLLGSLAEATVRDAVMVALASTGQNSLAGATALDLVQNRTGVVRRPASWPAGKQYTNCAISLEGMSEKSILQAGHDFGHILVGEVVVDSFGAQRPGPNWARLDIAEHLLQFLARCTESPDKAPVLCILGWIQWCKGRGTWAGNYFQACQEHQPGYRLASLLDELLAVGYIAECAKNQGTAWHGCAGNDDSGGES